MSLTFSQSAASGLVPLLARVALAAVLVPAGYHKVMSQTEFSGDDARRLRELQLVDATDAGAPHVTRVSLVQAAKPDDTTAPKGAPPAAAPQSEPQAAPPNGPKDASDAKPADGAQQASPSGAAGTRGGEAAQSGEPVKARTLHKVTLLVDSHGWRYPVAQAWAAALCELVGGALLLFGLFARLWALGAAVTMGVAFYFTSLANYAETSGFFRTFPLAEFNQFAAQVALFVLAFGILLSGAGAVSFDRLILGSGHRGSGASKATNGKKSPDG